MRVALVIGHGPNRDTGACNRNLNICELAFNRKLVPDIHLELDKKGVVSKIIHRVVERRAPVTEVNSWGADLAIEFHCNHSSSPTVSGTEMIYFPGSKKGVVLGAFLQEHVVDVLGLRDRGVKTPWKGRGGAFLSRTRCPAILAETIFITNNNDIRVARQKHQLLVQGYVNGILEYVNY